MSSWDRLRLEAGGYEINDRKQTDIEPIWEHATKFVSFYPNLRSNEIIYSGAEHTGIPKLPNVTFIPNIIHEPGCLMGTTFGHKHLQARSGDIRPFQEIYEFESYGGMLIRNGESTRLELLRPGEKVIVGTDDNMTLFNMSKVPLVTIDYANPKMNSAGKELEKAIGPAMMIWSAESEMIFRINYDYRAQDIIPGIRNTIVIRAKKGGEGLYEQIQKQANEFRDAGIEIGFGGNIPETYKKEFSKPLAHLVSDRNEVLFNSLQMK
jgi:hypothetical protein